MSDQPNQLSRRTLFAGVGTAGAVAAVASWLPEHPSDSAPTDAAPRQAPVKGGGYSLSEHVKRYYQTTRV